MPRISDMFLPLYSTESVSELYRFPMHSLHRTKTSERNCISICFTPLPLQAKHRPALHVK